MPNYIKNRISLLGSKEQIEKLLEKFSTFYGETPCKSYDGDNTYVNKTTDEYGWLNETTKVFKRRNQPDVIGVPEGFEIKYEEAFTRFPDFNKIVPMPESLSIESGSIGQNTYELLYGCQAGRTGGFMNDAELRKRFIQLTHEQQLEAVKLAIQYRKNIQLYGHATWYEWCIEHWGTKWNAMNCKKINNNVYEFETAWSGVPDIIEKMSIAFPGIEIIYEFSDEDTGSNCGIAKYLNGEVSFEKLKNQSNEAYELAFKLRPEYLEYYEKVNGVYKCKEE